MALGDKYATVAEMKTRLGLTHAEYDTPLGAALDAASRGVEKYCGRQFNSAGSTSARVYYPTNVCLADVDDLHTTTGLAVKTDLGDDGTFETTWASTDYQLEPLNGIVDGESGWPWFHIVAVESKRFPTFSKRAPLEVTANWGWAAVPPRVKEATLVTAEALFKLKDAPFGVAGFDNFGAVRVRQNPYVCELLDAYRRHAVLVG